MAELARFFDSQAGDRIYTASAWADIFGSMMSDGRVLGVGDDLEVTPNTPVAMSVIAKTGAAFIQGRYYENTANVVLAIAPSDPALNRIDRVVLRLDYTARTITVAIKQGVAAASPAAPALQRDASRYELALAQVSVDAAQVSVQAADVTDERDDLSLGGGASQTPSRRSERFQPPAATDLVLTSARKTDTFDRFTLRGDGRMAWGTGGAATDAVLERTSAGVLKLTGQLDVSGGVKAVGPKNILGADALTVTGLSLLDLRGPWQALTQRAQLGLYTTDAFAINKGGVLSLGGNWDGSGAATEFAGIGGIKENAASGDFAGALVLYSRAAGQNFREGLRLGSDGTVTISPPSAKVALIARGAPSTGADFAWVLSPYGAAAVDLLSGAISTAGAGYTAKAGSATIFKHINAGFQWFANTGLTPDVVFTPTRRMELDTTGLTVLVGNVQGVTIASSNAPQLRLDSGNSDAAARNFAIVTQFSSAGLLEFIVSPSVGTAPLTPILRLDQSGNMKAIGETNRFGLGALGAAGTFLNLTAGSAVTLMSAEGTPTNIAMLLRVKGTGVFEVQNADGSLIYASLDNSAALANQSGLTLNFGAVGARRLKSGGSGTGPGGVGRMVFVD